MKYSEKMREVAQIIARLKVCDDVDDAVSMFEKANALLSECGEQLERAQGRYVEITSKGEELAGRGAARPAEAS